jgi:hypothetical protein
MQKLVDEGLAPEGAIVPPTIEKDRLFHLDVDDEIWQDIGLDDETTGHAVPRWLGDEDVRSGIKARIQLDRCLEEEHRLGLERCNLQDWMGEEWALLHDTITATSMNLTLKTLL